MPVAPSPTAYATSCLSCGQQLTPVLSLDPLSAPWVCDLCMLGFWASELTWQARAVWVPGLQSFAYQPAAAITAAVDQEQAVAVSAGVSVAVATLASLTTGQLTALAALLVGHPKLLALHVLILAIIAKRAGS